MLTSQAAGLMHGMVRNGVVCPKLAGEGTYKFIKSYKREPHTSLTNEELQPLLKNCARLTNHPTTAKLHFQ